MTPPGMRGLVILRQPARKPTGGQRVIVQRRGASVISRGLLDEAGIPATGGIDLPPAEMTRFWLDEKMPSS
jgi:hypothetical protein